MQHDRYLIYGLKHHWIDAKVPKNLGGYKIYGVASDVHRDVVENVIKITVRNRAYVFDEPDRIYREGNCIIFAYGEDTKPVSDDEVFEEMRRIAGKGGVNEAIENLECNKPEGVVKFLVEGEV